MKAKFYPPIFKFFFFLSFFFQIACSTSDTEKQNVQISKSFPEKEKVLLVIAEDRSGSTHDLRKMNVEDYKEIIEAYAKKYCGEVAVRIIGNPPPQQKNFFRLNIDCYKPQKNIDQKLKLDKKAELTLENQKIAQENNEIMQQNKTKISNFIEKTIKPYIINYQPYNNNDLTNIVSFLEDLEKLLNEITFENYKKIDVLIISDGNHDADKQKLPEKLNLKYQNKINFYLIGWKPEKPFHKNVYGFESKDGFIKFYTQ